MRGHPAGRVLVVDPCPDNSWSLSLLLQVHGYQTQCLADGDSVLSICRAWRPMAVLLEIGLPGQDGWEVARRIREQDDLKDLFLIALTVYGQPKDRARSQEAGFDRHITKPCDPERLLDLLASRQGPVLAWRLDETVAPCAIRQRILPALHEPPVK